MKKPHIVFFLLFVTATLFSQEVDIDFSIRFSDKQIYFTDSQVYIKAEIKNNSANAYRFKVADNKVFNLDFDVRSLKNLRSEHSERFIRERNNNRPAYYKEVSLEPGESYSFTDDLSMYINFQESGVFLVQAIFYPALSSGDDFIVSKNTLTLSLQPRAGVQEFEALLDDITGEILKKEEFPPDHIVDYFITARQKGQWDKFFLYLDIEKLLLKDPIKARQYRGYSDERQRAMLDQFKSALKQEKTEFDILLVPSYYDILKTSYTAHEGTVKVIEKFVYLDFTEIKEYTYYLHKIDGIWMIYDYEILNQGTE